MEKRAPAFEDINKVFLCCTGQWIFSQLLIQVQCRKGKSSTEFNLSHRSLFLSRPICVTVIAASVCLSVCLTIYVMSPLTLNIGRFIDRDYSLKMVFVEKYQCSSFKDICLFVLANKLN